MLSWKVGLIPESIASGLASILVLFFLLSRLHGGLLDVGLVAAVSALSLIPSQMLWGKLIDGTRRCKPFLVIGFAGMGASLAAIPWSGSVPALLALISLKSVLYAATLPARQLLTVESEHHSGWRRGLAGMQFLTAMGETAGMGLGAITVSSLGYTQLFVTCGALCMASAAALGVVVREPGIMIQRKLVAMDRSVSNLVAVSELVTYPGRPSRDLYRKTLGRLGSSTKFLMFGVSGFSLAGSALFSQLPAYFLQFYSSNAVFLLFFGGSLAGALCYPLVGRLNQSAGRSLVLASSVRMIVTPLLVFAALGTTGGFLATVVLLAVLEAFWSVFDVTSTFAYLESARVGRAGFYGALIGLGAAGGGVLGGLVSTEFGFVSLFALCSVICASALVAFAVQYRSV